MTTSCPACGPAARCWSTTASAKRTSHRTCGRWCCSTSASTCSATCFCGAKPSARRVRAISPCTRLLFGNTPERNRVHCVAFGFFLSSFYLFVSYKIYICKICQRNFEGKKAKHRSW
uniref:Uncharacterized protein n=1 Tax=Anopheles melas TaxID=34690 RepID=A0A182TYE0_9DIPT